MTDKRLKSTLFIFLLAVLTLSMASFANGEVLINEFLANGVSEPSSEWIELYNNGSETLYLGNYNISDNTPNSNKTFENITIAPQAFVVLVRDNGTFNSTYSNFANITRIGYNSFTLNNDEDIIFLYNDTGTLIDTIEYAQDSATQENVPIGRFPDGTTNIINLSVQTPGAENDNLAPTLNSWLNGLTNNSNVTGNVNITINITDQVYEVNTSLIEIEGSNFSMDKNGDLWNFTWNTASNTDGIHNLTVYFNDSVGLSDISILYNMTVDNTGPNILFNSPVNNSDLPGTQTVNITVSDTVTSVDNVSATLVNGSGVVFNFTLAQNGNDYSESLDTSALSDGNYSISVSANDTVGKTTNSGLNITIDNTAPAVIEVTPANSSFVNSATPQVSFNITDLSGANAVSEVNTSSIAFTYKFSLLPATFTITPTTTAITEGYNVSGSITDFSSDGTVNLSVDAKDNAGNSLSTVFWSFTIDLTNPKVNSISANDSDSKANSSTPLNLTVNATDALAGVSIVNASNTNTTSLSQLASGDLWAVSTSASDLGCTSEGNCTITVSAYDAAGNVNSSETLTLIVDNSAPNVSSIIVDDADNKVRSTDSLLFNVTINDTNFDSGSTVTLGNLTNLSLSEHLTVNQTSYWNLTATANALGCSATDGTCILRLTTTDIVGNVNDAQTLTLTIDDVAPNVSISINDSDNSVNNITVLRINVTAADTNTVSNVSVNGTLLNNTAGNLWTTINATYELCPGVIDSTCTLTVTAYDEVSNANNSETLTLTISSFAPTISGIPDVTFNEDSFNDTLNLSQFITDDDTSINDITVSVLNNVNVTVSINQTTKIANISANADFNGSENIVFLASDGTNSDSDTIKVTVSPVNDAPTVPSLSSPANNSNVSTTNITLSWSASTDADEGDSITYFVYFGNTTQPEFNTSTSSTSISVNNLTKDVTYYWLVISGDGTLNSSNSSIFQFLEVSNRVPVLNSSISSVALTEDTADTSIDLDNHFSDEDNDALTFTSTTPSNITVSINSTTNVVTLTPNADFNGTNTINFTASDGTNSTSSNEVTLTVSNVNDAPVLGTIGSLTATVNKFFFFDANATDADTGDTLTFSSNSTLFAIGSSQGTFNITPSGSQVGSEVINITVNDTAGLSDSEVILFTITDIINSSEFTSPVLSLNETERQSANNITINQTTFGGIDFGTNTLNFSGIVNLEDAFNVSNGLISVDTDNFPGLNKSAFLVMKGLSFTKAPLILTASGFESTANNATCPSTLCGDISYDVTNGILRFNVTHFTTFFATTNTTNGAPVITSSPVTNAALNDDYEYDVDATDPDGDTLTFSLITAPSGMSISSSSGLITFTPSSLGNFSVTVNVSDGSLSDSQSYNLTVTEGARLRITDLDVKVGSKTDKNVQNNTRISKEAEPGDKVEFDLEIKNFFTNDEDLEIEDIDVEITIEDIDDGDDLDDDASEFDLKAGKDDNVKIDFEVPLDVEEDVFDVIIDVEGQDENGTLHEIRWKVELEVQKENHEIRVLRASATPSEVVCQRTISINTEIINTGSKDEDEVTLEILSSGLGIRSVTDDIELDEGTDDNRFTKLVTATIDDDIAPGIYPVDVNSYYDGKLSDSDTIDLTVGQCEQAKGVKEPVTEQPKVVVTTPKSGVTEQPEQPIEISFVDTDLYFVLLSIMIVIFIGTTIFIVGAAFIVLRK